MNGVRALMAGHHRCPARVVASDRYEGLSLRRGKVIGSSVCDKRLQSPQDWPPRPGTPPRDYGWLSRFLPLLVRGAKGGVGSHAHQWGTHPPCMCMCGLQERGGWYHLRFLPRALVVPMSSWECDPHADMVMSWGKEQGLLMVCPFAPGPRSPPWLTHLQLGRPRSLSQ